MTLCIPKIDESDLCLDLANRKQKRLPNLNSVASKMGLFLIKPSPKSSERHP